VIEPPTPEGVPAQGAEPQGAEPQGAEPQVGLSRLPWLHWPYVIVPLVALVMLLGAAAWAFPGLLARLQLGDYRAAERHIQEFAWPAGLNDDPTLTACDGSGLRCARTELTPEAAVRAVVPGLAAAGVGLGEVRCGAEAETSALPNEPQPWDCTAVAHGGGFSTVVRAADHARNPGAEVDGLALGYTYVALVVVSENDRLDALVAETARPLIGPPLPLRAADVPGLPSMLESLTCTDPAADGCRGFEGTITLSDARAADLDATAARLADELRAGGYFVEIEHCRDVSTGRRCTVSGVAFRGVGGSGFTSILEIISVGPKGDLSIRANVAAF